MHVRSSAGATPPKAGEGARLLAQLKVIPADKQQDAVAVRAAGSSALGRAASLDDILAVSVEYQQRLLKEASGDRRLVDRVDAMALTGKVAALALADAKIDEQCQEAAEKFASAMEAAVVGLVVASASAAAGGPAAVSDLQLAVLASHQAASGVTPLARDQLRARLAEILSRLTRAQETKASVSGAMNAVFASNASLASADRGKLLLLAGFQAYQKALEDLRIAQAAVKARPTAAPNDPVRKSYSTAVKRAGVSLTYLRAVLHKLR